MVKITIDVDGGSHDFHGVRNASVLASAKAKKIGLVSAIKLEPAMKQKFLAGAGLSQNEIEYGGDIDQKSYGKKDAIRKRRDDQKVICDVIATIGGNYAFDAINSDDPANNPPFVSLVGSWPPAAALNDKFLGGVSLESYGVNAFRKEYVKNLRGLTDAQVFLYTNKNSNMHAKEVASWNSDATVCASAAGGAGGANDPAGFSQDLTNAGLAAMLDNGGAAPGITARAVIISDDPFFRAFRDKLIPAVNTWIDGDRPNRYVVYPSQIYDMPVATTDARPRSNNSTLYGPDLMQAVFLLGLLARYCSDPGNQDTPAGVFSVPNVVNPITG